MSERLTKRTENGAVVYNDGEYWKRCYQDKKRLTTLDRMAIKLCELEDKIEQGELVELPCAVGEYVYRICGENTTNPRIWHWEIVEIMIYHDEIVYRDDSDNIIENKDFGKTVFLDRAAAEAKLREMEGDNNE